MLVWTSLFEVYEHMLERLKKEQAILKSSPLFRFPLVQLQITLDHLYEFRSEILIASSRHQREMYLKHAFFWKVKHSLLTASSFPLFLFRRVAHLTIFFRR